MSRAIRRVPKREMTRNYSTDPFPVDEFDRDPPTVEIPPQTMRALVYSEAQS